MKINDIELTKDCRHCDAIIDCDVKICPYCGKDTTYPLLKKHSGITFEHINKQISQAFFSLESFMNGRLSEYKYFGFNDAFTKLFFEAKKHENFSHANCQLIGQYWKLTEQIRVDYDRCNFENNNAVDDEFFRKDCEEILYLNWERGCEFTAFSTPNEILDSERKFSIVDITEVPTSAPQPTETEAKKKEPTFINNFDNITPDQIYKHFRAGLLDKGYLTEQELNEYLIAAFELKTIPKVLFKLKFTPTKQKIYTVFYVYYKDVAQKKHERQKDYAALLGEYFEGYKTKTIQTNWARGYNVKR